MNCKKTSKYTCVRNHEMLTLKCAINFTPKESKNVFDNLNI